MNAAEFLEEYLEVAELEECWTADGPLWRTTRGRSGKLTQRGMSRGDVLRMVKRRALKAGLPEEVCNHTFRATGITELRANEVPLESVQEIANHASPRTTQFYDRSPTIAEQSVIERKSDLAHPWAVQ